ncbi:unnamed protein product [Phytophthora fragariaefolia]|uniref:Unnamed protein product n=1 Tax=Phytophthora fragariaefolia TaxID=1490495 RepID=A0A9W6YG32_9STRA|nr:unnamed protein product [Phytophthora fragariaefolia]
MVYNDTLANVVFDFELNWGDETLDFVMPELSELRGTQCHESPVVYRLDLGIAIDVNIGQRDRSNGDHCGLSQAVIVQIFDQLRAMHGDNVTTLDEALAFIAFCDENPTGEKEAVTPNALEPLSFKEVDAQLNDVIRRPVSLASASANHSLGPTDEPPRQKKQTALRYTTSLQRRKKAEIQALRKEAAELEIILVRLRKGPGHLSASTATQDQSRAALWHREAIKQFRARHESEQINRRIRKMLEMQCGLYKS